MSRVAKIDENIYCPKCGRHEHQVRHGKNKSGSQKYRFNDCNDVVTQNHSAGLVPDEFFAQDERLRETVRRGLDLIREAHA